MEVINLLYELRGLGDKFEEIVGIYVDFDLAGGTCYAVVVSDDMDSLISNIGFEKITDSLKDKYDNIMCISFIRGCDESEMDYEEVALYEDYPLDMKGIIYELLIRAVRRNKDSEKGLILWTTAKNNFKKLYDD